MSSPGGGEWWGWLVFGVQATSMPGLRLVVVRVLGLYRIVDLVPALRTMVKMGKED
jgi:hypothetical protein